MSFAILTNTEHLGIDLTKYMQDTNTVKTEIHCSEIKDLNNWREKHIFMQRRLIQMPILPKLTHRFPTIPIKILAEF